MYATSEHNTIQEASFSSEGALKFFAKPLPKRIDANLSRVPQSIPAESLRRVLDVGAGTAHLACVSVRTAGYLLADVVVMQHRASSAYSKDDAACYNFGMCRAIATRTRRLIRLILLDKHSACSAPSLEAPAQSR